MKNLLVLEYWGNPHKVLIEDNEGIAFEKLKRELMKSGESGCIIRVREGAPLHSSRELLHDEDASEAIE